MTRIRVHVAPGAQRSLVVGRHGDGWKLRIAAPPEDGRANAEVARLLGEVLGIDRRDVVVVSGASARAKLVDLGSIDLAQVGALLDAAAGT